MTEFERVRIGLLIAIVLGILGLLQILPLVGSVCALAIGMIAKRRPVGTLEPAIIAKATAAIWLGVAGLAVTAIVAVGFAVGAAAN